MPCPPHPIELMANDADRLFERWNTLNRQLFDARQYAVECLAGAGPHRAWDALRKTLENTGEPWEPKLHRVQTVGDMATDGPNLDAYVPRARAAVQSVEEQLCVLRSTLAALGFAEEIPQSAAHEREMAHHLDHRKLERSRVLSQLRASLRVADEASKMREELLTELARVQAISDETLLCDRRCLIEAPTPR